jgi:hypothetical protein
MVMFYQGTITFDPMGHSLAVITSSLFMEHKNFRGATEQEIQTLRDSAKNVSSRYAKEILLVEEYLTEYGLGALPGELEQERLILDFLCQPAESDIVVAKKADTALEYIPRIHPSIR